MASLISMAFLRREFVKKHEPPRSGAFARKHTGGQSGPTAGFVLGAEMRPAWHPWLVLHQLPDALHSGHTGFLLAGLRHGRVSEVVCLQILEERQELYFHLQQQRLIELIRQGKTEEALDFAQDTLAPQGEENPEFLEELGMYPPSQPCSRSVDSCLSRHIVCKVSIASGSSLLQVEYNVGVQTNCL